ncbi:protein kinase [Pseudomonas asiatica]|uniref:protein kinase domain-containing protein n=1 Tax=Pseudomonas asiatica TaxID=2219225 RepID=UPI002DB65A19|nr:protein kinase [Pseudomonas asiatica]MEB6590513.1 protein kinase [Pseudomonas asiatica]
MSDNSSDKPKPRFLGGWQYDASTSLGRGGNGLVYTATKGQQKGALKILKSLNFPDRVARFCDEVSALQACSDIPGVIPVLDANTDLTENRKPWLVMGLATPMQTKLGQSPQLREVVQAILEIGVVLETMHARGFSHRDIKPDNLFFHEGRWTVGDFGLVSFAGKAGETAPHERLGPVFYIAPEMLNDAVSADGTRADVFSLAKTLWVLATGQHFPLPGVYDLAHEAFRLETYITGEPGITQLNKLIASASALTPEHRPTMSQMCNELRAWLAPKQELSLPIQFDTSEFDSLIEQSASSLDAQRMIETRHTERVQNAALRLQEGLRQFFEDVSTALKAKKLETLFLNYSSDYQHITLHAVVPNSQPASLILRLTNFLIAGNNLSFSCQIICEWLEARTKILYWKKDISFLEGGSEEAGALTALEIEIQIALQASLAQFLAVTFDTQKAQPKYSFKVTDENGAALPGAQIVIVSADGATYDTITDSIGFAELGHRSVSVPVAFVAHPAYHGAFVARPAVENHLQLRKAEAGGSFIYAGSGQHWPEICDSLELIHDSNSRMYMYAGDAVIDHGVRPPGYIYLGTNTHLKDKTGSCILLCPQAVRGGTFLVNVTSLPGIS